jgi:transcription factor TFIIIB component B''
MEPPAPKSNATPDTVVDVPTIEPAQSAQPEMEAPVQPSPETSVSGVLEQVPEPTSGAQSVNTNSAGPAPEVPGAMRPRKRRTLPWNAVNLPQEVEEEEVAPAPVKKTRKPPKTRGRKDATTTSEEQEAGQEGVEGDEAQQVRKRPSAKARGKRKADAAVNEDGTEAPAPAKRARKPRKVKSKEAVTDADVGEGAEAVEGEADATAEEGGEPVVRRKSRVPRAPRRKKRSSTEVEGEDGQDPAQPKRKGRPPREPTPEDAEEQEIDPEVTYMDSIASRNIRVGKLSAREKAMREIDWEAVKQRRREEDSRKIDSRAQIEAAEKLQIETAPQIDGPRYIIVDGQIQLQHNSTTINPEADADREIENYEVIEERDLTTRITSRSFLKNNKRFPNDFILPGQGKRWTAADTELFYEGLQHFGTDFQMISHMFPGSTRRSMKLKFTREERDNPARIREILLSRSTIVSHWDNFMQVSQLDEEKFANADAIKQEMADEEADFRARIEAAKAETAERKRQQKEAGLLDNEDENGNPIDKENAKGKKKRKGKEKQVAFAEDDGVEILGNVDDDDTWGQE